MRHRSRDPWWSARTRAQRIVFVCADSIPIDPLPVLPVLLLASAVSAGDQDFAFRQAVLYTTPVDIAIRRGAGALAHGLTGAELTRKNAAVRLNPASQALRLTALELADIVLSIGALQGAPALVFSGNVLPGVDLPVGRNVKAEPVRLAVLELTLVASAVLGMV